MIPTSFCLHIKILFANGVQPHIYNSYISDSEDIDLILIMSYCCKRMRSNSILMFILKVFSNILFCICLLKAWSSKDDHNNDIGRTWLTLSKDCCNMLSIIYFILELTVLLWGLNWNSFLFFIKELKWIINDGLFDKALTIV